VKSFARSAKPSRSIVKQGVPHLGTARGSLRWPLCQMQVLGEERDFVAVC
jgi:hypothetical protein